MFLGVLAASKSTAAGTAATTFRAGTAASAFTITIKSSNHPKKIKSSAITITTTTRGCTCCTYNPHTLCLLGAETLALGHAGASV